MRISIPSSSRLITLRHSLFPLLLALTGLGGLLLPSFGWAQTRTFSYASNQQSYTVPDGVTLVQVVALAGSGGSLTSALGTNPGGLGAQVQAIIPVTPGEQLTILTGGQGAGSAIATSNAGGFNGGGTGTSAGGTSLLANGGGGGGATELRRAGVTDDYLTSRYALLVAGGGGGSGNGGGVMGGDGGTPNGATGGGSGGGAGATQDMAGGSALNNQGSAGRTGGGGGGGGGYRGAQGGSNAGGGGGGSSWVTSAATGVSFGLAAEEGNGSLTITPVSPMPVQLVRFTARRLVADQVVLSWETASELHNQGFEVQRSAEGAQWTGLTFLAGAGSSAQARTYAYTDALAPAGAAYYRLRQVDQDGTATFSAVVVVAEATEATRSLTLYPNPATGALVQVSGAPATAPLRLVDAQGRLVREWPAGTGSLDAQGLPAGLYLLRVGQAAQRLVLP